MQYYKLIHTIYPNHSKYKNNINHLNKLRYKFTNNNINLFFFYKILF